MTVGLFFVGPFSSSIAFPTAVGEQNTMVEFTSLAQALKELTKDTKVVNLTGVDVRDAGISDLAFALRKCTSVTELILSDCKLGPQAAVHLSTFLKYNKPSDLNAF